MTNSGNPIMLNQVEISVVIPVHMGRKWLHTCLDSLSKQTLHPSMFEAVLVFNGPDDGAKLLLQEYSDLHPDLQLRSVDCPVPSASVARNMGTAAAKGTYLTWVDCDDWVSPEYLELMFLSASKGIIPLAQIVNVDECGIVDPDNLINKSILAHSDAYVSPKDFPRGLSFMVCKLLPTWMARAVKFDEKLKSGEDVALYGSMFARFPFEFSLIPAYAGARYYRLMRDGSVSRQANSFDFLVKQRADVIGSLNSALMNCRPEARGLVMSFINSQASFIRRYFREHEKEQESILELLMSYSFSYFPWTNWFENTSSLVIAYNFLPYADTGAMVTAKRIRQGKMPVDVVTHRMDNVRKSDPENNVLAHPYVQFTGAVPGPAYFAGYGAISHFSIKGIEIIDGWVRNKGRKYEQVYSRAMWPASHFLAALYKVRNPEVVWTAEFSDPVQLSSTGEFRSAPFELDSVALEILDGLDPSSRGILEDNMNVYFWTEYLAYFLADKIVFTNSNQLQVMSGYVKRSVVSVLFEKAVVSQQPTLEAPFYHKRAYTGSLIRSRANLAYFGEFYSTRGLDEVLEGILSLGRDERSFIQVHIFTSNVSSADARIRSLGLEDIVSVRPSLPFFEFLNALTSFDVLIVNDASTVDHHSINPYLPSKLSDYIGSGSDIWAVYEKGSPLSSFGAKFRSPISDPDAAADVLRTIIGSLKAGFSIEAP